MESITSIAYELGLWVVMLLLVFGTSIAIELKAYTLPIDEELSMIEDSLAQKDIIASHRQALKDRRVQLQAQRVYWVCSAPNSTRNTVLGIVLGALFFIQVGASLSSLVWLGLLCFLTFLAFMDSAHQLIPERFIFIIFTLGCALNVMTPMSFVLLPAPDQSQMILLTIAVMGLLLLLAYWVTRWRTGQVFSDQMLGSGDVLLIFALSSWFGANLLWVVMMGCIVHITLKALSGAYSKKNNGAKSESGAMAFVPGLAAGAIVFSLLPASWFAFLNLNQLPLWG